ncbi:MAG: hypothetical protein ABIV26_01415, partial [Candidatus Limnocylindrales bacterium]
MSDLIARFIANPFVTSLLLGLAATVAGLWLAACWWAYRDAARRTGGGVAPFLASAWIFLSTPLMLPMSVAAYTLLRPQEAAGDRRVRGLLGSLDAAELDDRVCPSCAAVVDPAWRRCPICAEWLGLQCDRCERWAPRDAELCPWCAWAPGERTDVPMVIGTATHPFAPALAPMSAGNLAPRAPQVPASMAAMVRHVVPASGVAAVTRRQPQVQRARPATA